MTCRLQLEKRQTCGGNQTIIPGCLSSLRSSGSATLQIEARSASCFHSFSITSVGNRSGSKSSFSKLCSKCTVKSIYEVSDLDVATEGRKEILTPLCESLVVVTQTGEREASRGYQREERCHSHATEERPVDESEAVDLRIEHH